MCGRSTYKLTWEEIVALYRLTLEQPPVNTRARYNVCPTMTIDTIHRPERRAAARPHAFGPGAVLVVEAAQGIEAGDIQRESRDGGREADVSRPVQKQALPHSCVGLLWDEWRDKSNGETLKSCAMIITEPNEFVAEVHDRMRKKISSRG